MTRSSLYGQGQRVDGGKLTPVRIELGDRAPSLGLIAKFEASASSIPLHHVRALRAGRAGIPIRGMDKAMCYLDFLFYFFELLMPVEKKSSFDECRILIHPMHIDEKC